MVNKPRKIIYLITKSNWGGAQRYVYDLATNLDRQQFEPIVAFGGNGTLKELLVHAGIRVVSIEALDRDMSLKKELLFAKELWHLLVTEKPDILHVNSSKAGGIGTLLGRLAHVPKVIFTAHGWAFNEDRPVWQKFVIKFLHWLTVLFSHTTIAVSTAIVNQLNWPLAKRKMRVINPGRTIGVMYKRDEARLELAKQKTSLSLYTNDPWIITIAELHPIKRLDNLISALSSVVINHPQVRCVIIGEGQERNKLQTQIDKSNLQQHAFLLGNVIEAARFLKAGDLFVLTSKSESYGYVLHEAGLAGLPIIATNVGGITDIITNHETGVLIPPDNFGLLAKVITDYFDQPLNWLKYTEALTENLKKRSVRLMVIKTTALYLHSLQ